MKKFIAAALTAAVIACGIPSGTGTVSAAFTVVDDGQEAVEKNRDLVLAAVKDADITNDTTKDDFESLVAMACKYSTDKMYGTSFEIYEYKLTKATSSSAGALTATVVLSMDDGEIDFVVKKTIPKLSGGSDDAEEEITSGSAKDAIIAALDKMTVSNTTQDDVLLRTAEYAAPDGAAVTLDSFKLTEATGDSAGSIAVKLTVTLADGTKETFSHTVTIAKTTAASASDAKKILESASSAVNKALENFAVSNDTTKTDLINMAKAAVPENVKVTLDDSDFSITKATTSTGGLVSARIVLTCDGQTKTCPIGKSIPEVVTADSKGINADWSAAGKALSDYKITNKTTKEDLLAAARAACTNGSAAEWEGSYEMRKATFSRAGHVFGYMKFTLGSEVKELRFSTDFAKLAPRLFPSDKISVTASEWDILRIVNNERAADGQLPLTMIEQLQKSSGVREPEVWQEFSHTRPDGTICFTAIEGPSFASTGENIAKQCNLKTKTVDTARMMNSWMNSPGHRANILKSGYNYIGIGTYVKDSLGVGVQMFGGRGSEITNVVSSNGTMTFEDEEDMERNYLICTASDGTVSYMPLDTDILTRTADGYTLNIYGASDIKLTVKNSDWPVNVNASFDDVKSGEYYVLPIRWAVAKGITTGTSQTTFSPTAYCTRAQIITFLWRAAGAPKTEQQNPFTDVSKSDYYYYAAVWAYSKNMLPAGTFNGDTLCTRGAAVHYMWCYAGQPKTSPYVLFIDVPPTSEYYSGVTWAYDETITLGTGDSTFSPDAVCDRGQIVTLLHRAFK